MNKFARSLRRRACPMILALATTAVAMCVTRGARAELDADAQAVASLWAAVPLRAKRLAPLFLEQARPRAVHLPASAYDTSTESCTTVAVLAGRSVDFVVRIDPLIVPKHAPVGGNVERSLAGSVVLVRCGAERAALARLSVELRVARGAAEIVVAEGATPAPGIAAALPERATGPVAPLNDAGPRPPLERVEARIARREGQASRAGAVEITHRVFAAHDDGGGHERLRLDEGCHDIGLFAAAATPNAIDLDAELREAITERLVARDRSDSADAKLDLCVGTPSTVDLFFAGAQGAVPVVLSDARYSLPLGIPVRWGTRARAGVAAAMRRRKVPAVPASPVYELLGAAGRTTVPLENEPGACYIAAAALTRGDAHPLAITASLGARVSYDPNLGQRDAAIVAYCANDEPHTRIDIEARGASLAWVLDVWQVARRDAEAAP